MKIRSIAAGAVLAALGIAGATGGHAAGTSTETYQAASPGGGGSCSGSGYATGIGSYSLPNVGAACWSLNGTAGTATVTINDALSSPVRGAWTLVTWADNGTAAHVATNLATGDFCGSATLAVPSNARALIVALGGVSYTLPNGWLVSSGSSAPCADPVHGTVTASLPGS
ncbi:MAG: hypothetical protein ABR498_01670 [Candidatus Dormibacteria bacterium]